MKRILSLVLVFALIGTMFVSAANVTVIGKAGDANMDGEVNIIDVVAMRAHIVGSLTLEGDAYKCADINEDGTVDIIDVVMARNAIVNNIDLGDVVVPGVDDPVIPDTDSDIVNTDSDVVNTDSDTPANTDSDVVVDTDSEAITDVEPEYEAVRFEFEDAIMEGATVSYVPDENVTVESTSNGKVAKFPAGANRAYFEIEVPADDTYKVTFVAVGLSEYDRKIQFYIDGQYNEETVPYTGWKEFTYEVELTKGTHTFGAKADGAWGWEWEWLYVDYLEIVMPVVEDSTDTDVAVDTDVVDTDAELDSDLLDDTDIIVETDTDVSSKTYRIEIEDATVKESYTVDSKGPSAEASGSYYYIGENGYAYVPFVPEYTGNYSFSVVAAANSADKNAKFIVNTRAGETDNILIAQMDVVGNGNAEWVTYRMGTVDLVAGQTYYVGTKVGNGYNYSVDYFEAVIYIEEEIETDTETEVDTDIVTDVETDTDIATDIETDTDVIDTDIVTDVETDTDVIVDTDIVTDVETDTDTVVDTETEEETDEEIPAGIIATIGDWFTTGDGSDTQSTISSVSSLANGGLRVNIDLEAETYTYLTNFPNGLDLTDYSTLSLVVTNPNANSIQIQPIFKVGTAWTWTEYDQYQEVPANTTTVLTFDMSGCATRNNVMAVIFRIQSGSVKFAGNVDILSMGYDLPANAYANEIAEINRPKSADAFTWAYPESDWTAKTTGTSVENGVITVNFSGITATSAAGVQTETKPGLGAGLDCSDYSTLTCTITNNSADDIHITLVLKTGGGWLWQENGGVVVGSDENERIIAAGESVDVTYELKGSTWKSADSGWAYSGTLSGAEDVRAIAFKIYTGESETATGSVEISNFAFNF